MYMKSINEIVAETMYKLLREKSYHDITQLDIMHNSGLNRATLGRSVENTEELFFSVIEAERNEIRSLYCNREAHSPKELQTIAQDAIRAVVNRTERLSLLAGSNGDPSLLCRSSRIFVETMWQKAVDGGFADRYIRFLLGADAFAATLWLYRNAFSPAYEKAVCLEEKYGDFTPSGSFFADVGGILCAECGGTPDEHQQLAESAVRMFAGYDGRNFSVAKLLQNTAISRVKFYKYYRSMNDFLERKRSAEQFVCSVYAEKTADGSFDTFRPLASEVAFISKKCKEQICRENSPVNRCLLDIFSTGLDMAYRRMLPKLTGKFGGEEDGKMPEKTYFLVAAVLYSFFYAADEAPEISGQTLCEYISRLTEELRKTGPDTVIFR